MALLDYETIKNNAFANLGTIRSNAITKKNRVKELLAEYFEDSAKNREKSHLANRESASARGILQSGQSLKDIDETNTNYNTANDRAQRTADDQITGIEQEVAGAQSAYDVAESNYAAARTIEEQLATEAKRKEFEKKQTELAQNAIAQPEPPAPVDFLTWHSQLSPEDKLAFNNAYAAPKPPPAPKPPAKPKAPVVSKPKAPVTYTPRPTVGKKYF